MNGNISWNVYKFGGTSVGDAERMRKVAEIINGQPTSSLAVVLSAAAGVTDSLIALLDSAAKRDEMVYDLLDNLIKRHYKMSEDLLSPYPERKKTFNSLLDRDADDIRHILKTVGLSRQFTPTILDLVSGYGELWSTALFSAYLLGENIPAIRIDARDVLIIEEGELGPIIDWSLSRSHLNRLLCSAGGGPLIITGYVASTHQGVPTTLKRNGSDFSASIFAALLSAKTITIWTDVDGVYSADPRKVSDAVILEELSYLEAVELAYFGAKIVHPHTMAPAIADRIPIFIRNTFHPEAPGTLIHDAPRSGSTLPVKGFSTIDDIALINVEGTGMIGIPGVASRLFAALKQSNISVILITQASSEQSICFAVPGSNAERAKAVLQGEFDREIAGKIIHSVEIERNVSIIAAVGDDMVKRTGIAATLFSALAGAGISVKAIAQGSSERNISVVVEGKDSGKGLKAVHAGFFLSNQIIAVGLIGPGSIGSTLLRQLATQARTLADDLGIEIRLRALANSRTMTLTDPFLSWTDLPGSYETLAQPIDLSRFADHLLDSNLAHAAIIDCTSSDAIAGLYPKWMKMGIHVLTPNKKACSGSIDYYRQLKETVGAKKGQFYYEATVGAGLPVISTLKDLINTGDRILKIEGVFSGTLSFLFNRFAEGKPFSAALSEAIKRNYTEPDPRDDLSGMDVARKLIILAREAGSCAALCDVEVQSLIPISLVNCTTVQDFVARIAAYDSYIAEIEALTSEVPGLLRYVGVYEPGNILKAEVRRYLPDHPFSSLKGGENIIAFTTERYKDYPLIVRGPGAGPEVTAGGVFGDILRLCATFGGTKWIG